MRAPVPELELEDNNGTVYPLEWPGRQAISVSGLGMPDIQHWTTRPPFSHGRVHWGYAFQERIVNLVLYLRGCNRTEMWELRAENCAMFNPLNGPHKLRLTYPNGHAFEVHDGWYNDGYELSSQEGTERTQVGGVQLMFCDPFWKWTTSPLDAGESRDAAGRTCVETNVMVVAAQLVLPFTGPYLLGCSPATATLNCTNDGTWAVKPVITITGPTEDWILSNPASGHIMTWDGYTIAAGETVTLDVPAKTVTTTASGDRLNNYVGGNFATFELVPGLNALAFFSAGSAVNGVTTVGACWYVELIGT